MPEEWLHGNVPQGIGRKFGLSVRALDTFRMHVRERVDVLMGRHLASCFQFFGIGRKAKPIIPKLDLMGTREENLRRMIKRRSLAGDPSGLGAASGLGTASGLDEWDYRSEMPPDGSVMNSQRGAPQLGRLSRLSAEARSEVRARPHRVKLGHPRSIFFHSRLD